MTKEPQPDVIARHTDPFNRFDGQDALDAIHEQLLTDLRNEARRAGWPDDYEINVMVTDADLSTNTCILRAEAVRRD